jgi:hypothetical protein
MEYVYRHSIKPGKAVEYRDWLAKNHQIMKDHASEGWSYLGTWFDVRGFGSHDAESRWEIDDYSALGAGFGDEEMMTLLGEFFSEFVDHTHKPEAVLLKSASDVQIAAGS